MIILTAHGFNELMARRRAREAAEAEIAKKEAARR
jgi:hypothetical protein